ncbi:hypothetical protein O1M63_53755 [Streptomyces mirabilis]|nr:hypothetical protein [Streptomyces mirabilis]
MTDRRAVHLLLARVLRGEGESPRRSWHRGAAALGPSRRLAAEPGRPPTRAHRGRPRPGLRPRRTRRRAVPEPSERARLLARAAADAWRSGDADRARRLVAATDDDALGGLLALRAGNATDAFDALLTAAVRYAQDGPGPARTDHPSTPPSTSSPAPPKPRSTPATCAGAGGGGRRRPARDRAARHAGRAGRRVRGPVRRRAGPAEGGGRALRSRGDPTLLIHSGIAALMLGDHTAAATATVRAAASARAGGDGVTVPQAMEFRAYADFWTGRPRAAEAATLEALRQAYTTGQDNGPVICRRPSRCSPRSPATRTSAGSAPRPPAPTPSPAGSACPPRWPCSRSPSST